MRRIILKNRGFTIIETLVAVALLMISIAGPMVVANQALTAAVNSRNSFIATNLAQEGMEYLKNIKDNNVISGSATWLTGIDNANAAATTNLAAGSGTCVRSNSSSQYECTTPDPAHSTVPTTNCTASCSAFGKLYLDTTGYQTTSTGTTTPFTRYFYITPVPLASGGFDPNQAVFTVAVSWYQGQVSNQITVQELMTNSLR